MERRKFKADLYRLRSPNGAPSVGEIIERVSALKKKPFQRGDVPTDDNLWGRDHKGDYLALDNSKKYKALVGTVVQLRMDDLDVIADHNGVVPGDGGLKENQGHARHVAFLWDPDPGVIWFQNDLRGAAFLAFKDYLRTKSGYTLLHNGVYDGTAIKRALKLKTFKEFRVSFEGLPEFENAAQEASDDLKELMKIRDRYGAARIEVRLLPAPRESLGARLKKMLRGLDSMIDQDEGRTVKKAWVRGSDEDDDVAHPIHPINLLRDRHAFSIDVPVGRFSEPTPLMNTMRQLWNEQKSKVPSEAEDEEQE